MTLDIAAIKARAGKAERAWASFDCVADCAEDVPALIAALETSEAARVKAAQERDALREALKPFARTVPYDFAADHEPVAFTATGGEFRAARRALESSK